MAGLFTKESALVTLKNKKEKTMNIFTKVYEELMATRTQAEARRTEIKAEISDLNNKVVDLETEEAEVYLFEEEVRTQADKIKAIIS